MAYIVFCYSFHSPYAQKVADILERKKMILKDIGVDLQKVEANKEHKVIISKLILARNDFASHVSLTFLCHENNYKWLEICRLSELISDTHLMLQEVDIGSKKTAAEIAKYKAEAYQKSKPYRVDMDRLMREVAQEEVALQNFIASHILLEKRRALITPERVALALELQDNKTDKNIFDIDYNSL